MQVRDSAIEDNRVQADKNLKIDETAEFDAKCYQYLVTVDMAEEDEEALTESIRAEIKMLIEDDREGANVFLKSFGSEKKEKEKEKDGDVTGAAVDVEKGADGEVVKTGNKRTVGSTSAKSMTSKKTKKNAPLGPIVDPRKLRADFELDPLVKFEAVVAVMMSYQTPSQFTAPTYHTKDP